MLCSVSSDMRSIQHTSSSGQIDILANAMSQLEQHQHVTDRSGTVVAHSDVSVGSQHVVLPLPQKECVATPASHRAASPSVGKQTLYRFMSSPQQTLNRDQLQTMILAADTVPQTGVTTTAKQQLSVSQHNRLAVMNAGDATMMHTTFGVLSDGVDYSASCQSTKQQQQQHRYGLHCTFMPGIKKSCLKTLCNKIRFHRAAEINN